MQNEAEFRQHLKRAGKKEHVIDGLASQVRPFEAYLADTRQVGLEAAGEQDIRSYAESLSRPQIKARMRGLLLYYRFVGNDSLADVAAELRERETAKTRRAFKLRKFRGVDPEEVAKLEAIGVVTVQDMLAAGKTPQARAQLAERTGISLEAILEMVKLSDLSRLGAVKAVRARLYYDAGLDAPHKFVDWEPEALRRMLSEFVERTGFDGIAPLPKELRNAVATANRLPDVVEY